eukprot:TRINITY_DN267_c0_g1_i2.p1 TRINITY_DN267_c0_g1~~TRINITY_DN267_c0_g1_i2.p1  ORF type:complete len:156 (-),score=22.64 TRINITY_DN267_c0_g1_i2:65-532(-)
MSITLQAPPTHSKEQLADYREAFDLFDKDGNGQISAYELQEILRFLRLPCTLEDAVNMINEVDTDRNGTIEWAEFLELVGRRTTNTSEDVELKTAFEAFDLNKDGVITAADLRAVMASVGEPLSEEDVWVMIRETDSDNDGRVTLEDFVRIIRGW